jgi:hypothetical protein
MKDDDEVDWDRFGLSSELVEKTQAQARKSSTAKQRFFIKFPCIWQEQLAAIQASASTYRVALHLLDKARRSAVRPLSVTLANTGLRAAGVGRRGKAVALRELCKAGLIGVEQRPSRSPVVTLRFLD